MSFDRQPLPNEIARRDFMTRAGVGAATLGLGLSSQSLRAADAPVASKVAFFVVGDTHYLANKETPERMDVRSTEICGRLVDTLNRLPGSAIPDAAGGGVVAQVAG